MSFEKVAGGIADLINASANYEAAKNGSFTSGGNAQLATTYAPEVDAQNKGAPNSYGVQSQQKTLVGDESKTAVPIDRKWLMIGGGLIVVAAVVVALKN
ncbi:MAG: hypothetical protein R3309_04940 [Reinekea sp.]|nr:hypothetical protein [Reinekea sp.]